MAGYNKEKLAFLEKGKPALFQKYDKKRKELISVLYLVKPMADSRVDGARDFKILSYVNAKEIDESSFFSVEDSVAYSGLGRANYSFAVMALNRISLGVCASRDSSTECAVAMWEKLAKSDGYQSVNLPKAIISKDVEDWAADDILEKHGISEEEYDRVLNGQRDDISLHPMNCGWSLKPDPLFRKLLNRSTAFDLSDLEESYLVDQGISMFQRFYDNGSDLVDMFDADPEERRKESFQAILDNLDEMGEPLLRRDEVMTP